MKKHGGYPFSKKIKYLLDEFVSKGFLAQILLLAGVAVALTLLFGVVALWLGQPDYTEGYWISLMHMIDQGTITADEAGSDSFFIFMLFVTFIGMAFTSTIIAIVNNAIQGRLDDLKKGHSAIIEKNHILILGFDASACTICRELLEGAQKNREHFCLVVADDLPKETMEQSLRAYRSRPSHSLLKAIENRKYDRQIKVLIRSGDPSLAHTFAICAAESAKIIFINRENDPETIRILLALSAYLKKAQGGGSVGAMPEVLALIHDKENMPAARAAAGLGLESASSGSRIRILNDQELMGQFFAQACVHRGLPYVMDGLFNYRGSSVYIEKTESREEHVLLLGKTLPEISGMVGHAIPLGFARSPEGRPMEILLNPPAKERYLPRDRLIYLSNTPELSFEKPAPVTPLAVPSSCAKAERKRLNFLIIGQSDKLPDMIQSVRGFCGKDSSVTLLVQKDKANADHGIRYSRIDSPDPYRWANVEPVLEENRFWFDPADDRRLTNLVILPPDESDKQQADEKLMMLLLNLQPYLAQHAAEELTVTSEILLPQNQMLLQKDTGNDYVIASEISDRVMAQFLEEPQKYDVIKSLLQPENGVLLLNPLTDYADTEQAFNFEGIFRIAAEKRAEIPLGWIRFGTEDAAAEGSGLVLNPGEEERERRHEGGDYRKYRLVVFSGGASAPGESRSPKSRK